jgi:hypothetical protein
MEYSHADLIVFWTVVSGRFLLPLFIPIYPLPAILICLILDAADNTILYLFTGFDMAGYQSYDKALDIFYLSIAMLTTLRNWKNFQAVKIARVLFYLRLIGGLLFELSGARIFLLIFPNVFEYFFIFYEGVRAYWSPSRLNVRFLIKSVIIIWVLIKMPQEYWLHIARLDVTDLITVKLLGMPSNLLISEAIAHLIIVAVAIVLITILVLIIRRVAPPAEHPLKLSADPLPGYIDEVWERDLHIASGWRYFDRHLMEKIILVGFLSVIFGEMLPEMNISSFELFTGIGVFVVFNTFLRLQHVRMRKPIESAIVSFMALALINAILAFGVQLLLSRGILSLSGQRLLFFLLLLTLIVTLYDRWRPVYNARFRLKSFPR